MRKQPGGALIMTISDLDRLGPPPRMSAPCADRIRYTGKHVSQLDCSGQSHASVTGDSAGQRFRSLTQRFSKRAGLHDDKAENTRMAPSSSRRPRGQFLFCQEKGPLALRP